MKAAAFLANRYPFVNDLLTKRRTRVLMIAAAIVFATQAAVFAISIATSENYVTVFGPVVGGDFIAFDRAAEMARDGDIAAIYDAEMFSKALLEAFPAHGAFRLSWQYPPTAFLLIWPLAFLPYLSSYALWMFAGGGVFLLSIRNIWSDRAAIFLVIASPAAFQSMITGQTGFLTAGLLCGAALWADRRPLLAGLAAGVLTFKPQLGLLIPVVFAAAGCWRAFGAAAATSAAMALASIAIFGLHGWSAFFEAVMTHGARMQTEVFPHHKLVSVFGGATMLGAPASAAMSLQMISSAALAAIIAAVWRRVKDWDLRLAVLCAAAPLVSPYAFYYEAAVLIPAALAVARRGVLDGWLKGERPALILLWLAPMGMPGPVAIPSAPYSFLIAAGVFALALRRTLHAARSAVIRA